MKSASPWRSTATCLRNSELPAQHERAAGIGLRAIVLGSGAGGGVPQWNCTCRVCRRARAGDPRVQPRTQATVAVSGDGEHWLLICASPDLRQQLLQCDALAPRGDRDSPVCGVVLLNGEIDGIAGLLTLRERHAFRLFAAPEILRTLDDNPIFAALDRRLVSREALVPGQHVACCGLEFSVAALPGKVPLYQERPDEPPQPAESYAALIEQNGRRLLVAPGCAEIDAAVLNLVASSDVALFDGTLFRDDEMVTAGLGTKTGRRMGHVPISGPGGSLARLAGLKTRVVLLHINNTNPILIEDSPERRIVQAAEFEIAWDGMEICLA